MPARPRPLRRVMKWGGISLCAVIAFVWFTSRWYGLYWLQDFATATCRLELASGRLEVAARTRGRVPPQLRDGGMSLMKAPGGARHWFWLAHISFERMYGASWLNLTVPLWIPLLASAVPPAILACGDRRTKKQNLCPHCSYPLSGLPNSPCPECGKKAIA